MSRGYKIIIAVLSTLCVLLTLWTLWLRVALSRIQEERQAEPSPATAADAAETTGDGEAVISELMGKNRAVLTDEDGDFSDWIELYNPSDAELDLEGWTLSDREDGPGWSFPAVTLGSGEYMLVFADGKDRRGGTLHTDFSLGDGETVYLRGGDGALHSQALCGQWEKDLSLAADGEGGFAPSLYPSPGFENSAQGYESFQQTRTASGALVINEAMVYNDKYLYDPELGYLDWVEIKNISADTVRLEDYYLSDDGDDYFLWRLPEAALAPGETMTILCAGSGEALREGAVCAPLSLDSENEQLYLCDGGGRLWDYMSLRDLPYRCSYGRMDGQGGGFYFASPSPGEDNREGLRTVAEKPWALSGDGVFENSEGVDVELTAAGDIRYTLDGSAPDGDSLLYQGPIHLTETAVLRAVALEPGALPSRTLTLSYIINEGHSLPVVSLCTDDPYSFNSMYEVGQKDLELPGNLAYYGEDGSFSIGCGISMNGMTSLSMPKKNMSLRFRGAYGQSALSYDLYGGGVTEFTNLLLRAGQDQTSAIIRNELCQELCAMATDKVINQRSRYAVLYVNGAYTGIYSLKEKANEQLYASLAGVSRDSVTLLEPPVDFDGEFYQSIIRFAIQNDLRIDENYQHICSQVDLGSFIDFLIMEGFCANADVTSGNMRFVRSDQNDGKWRFMFYDLDSTFMLPSAIYTNLMSEFARENIQISEYILRMMENPDFKEAFLTRASQLLRDTLTDQAVLDTMDALAREIAPEVERDHKRYDMTVESWETSLGQIRELVEDVGWRQRNIDGLCQVFYLSAAERERYFGEIEG